MLLEFPPNHYLDLLSFILLPLPPLLALVQFYYSRHLYSKSVSWFEIHVFTVTTLKPLFFNLDPSLDFYTVDLTTWLLLVIQASTQT